MINSSFARRLCLYHYPCPDGIFAALVVHIFHKQQGLECTFKANTTWKPLTCDDLALVGDELVYLVDFTGAPGFAAECSRRAARCVVLDHHKTAEAELMSLTPSDVPNLEINFDMQRCGAVIALDYFKPQLPASVQEMYAFIQDADLWQWKLPNSKAFHAGILSLGIEWNYDLNPTVFDQLLALTPEEVIQRGHAELAHQDRLVMAAVSQAFEVQLGGAAGAEKGWGRALAAVVDEETSMWRSQLGNALADEAARRGLPPVGVVAYLVEGNFKVSLRSVGELDMTPVSQAFGGGGHRNASSFVLPDAQAFQAWRA